MITQSETGLTTTEYAVLQTAQESPEYALVLHRWNFAFTSFHTGVVGSAIGNDFDCQVVGTHLIRVVHTGIWERYDGMSWANGTIPSYPASALGPVALATSGINLYVYVMCSDGIRVNKTTDYGDTWTGWQVALSWADVTDVDARAAMQLAVFKPGYVFHTRQNLVTREVRLYYSTPTGEYTITSGETDIYFSNAPRGMSAISLPTTTDANRALLVMTLDVPGRTTARYVENKPVIQVFRSGGLLAFVQSRGIISEHIEIDTPEQYTNWRYRESPRLSNLNGKLFLLAAAGDGTARYHFSRYRYYTSKSGEEWSDGFILPGLSANALSGLKLLQLDNYVYALNRRQVWQSASTLLNENSTVSYDITDRVLSWQSNVGDMHQASLMLSNEDGFFDNLDFTSKQNTWAAKVFWGYHSAPMQQVGLMEIDSFEHDERIDENGQYEKIVRCTMRDRMGWLTERQSEQARYWQAQLIGADYFGDPTQTSFGGLMHTAQQSGAFRTEDNTLLLIANNEEGVAFSTFDTSIWNGGVEYGVRLSQANNNEYAGVCFRARDKDNLWYAAYFQATDRIHLRERRGGVETEYATSATLSWSSAILTGWKFIRAQFRYNLIRLFTSDDGRTWTQRIEHVMRGARTIVGESAPVKDRPLERGFVGCIGKGYSTIDEWDYNSLPIDDGVVLDESGRLPAEVILPENNHQASVLLMLTPDSQVWQYTLNYGATTAVATNKSPALAICQQVTFSEHWGDTQYNYGAYHLIYDPFDSNRVIVHGAGGFAIGDNIWGTPSWSFKSATAGSIRPAKGWAGEYPSSGQAVPVVSANTWRVGTAVVAARTRKGYFAWASGGYFYYTTDYFNTVNRTLIGSTINSIAIGPYNTASKGEIWLAVGRSEGDVPGLYRSLDWGKTFTRVIFTQVTAEFLQVVPSYWHHVHIPLTTAQGVPNKKHQNIWGTFSFVTIENCHPSGTFSAHQVYAYNLWVSPYTNLFFEVENSHYVAFPGKNRAHYTCPADGRAHWAAIHYIDNSADPICPNLGASGLPYLAYTDQLDGNYYPLPYSQEDLGVFGRQLSTSTNSQVHQLMGFPTNKEWMVALIGHADEVMITNDGWLTRTSWRTALANAFATAGGTPLFTGGTNYYSAVLPDVRPIAGFVETSPDEWAFDDTFDLSDWLNDDFGLGNFALGPEYCISFCRHRVHNMGRSYTLEDAFKVYASFAGLHDFRFKTLYAPDNGLAGWTTPGAVLSAAGSDLTLTPTWTNSYQGCVHATVLPHNYMITASLNTLANKGFFINLRGPTLGAFNQTHYFVGFDGASWPQVLKYNVSTTSYDLLYKAGDAPASVGEVAIAVREIVLGSDKENFWLVISVYVNKRLHLTMAEWIKESPETDYYFGVGSYNGAVTYTNLRIPQLTEFVEWHSIDPGETAMGGLQRAIDGRYTRMFVRWDGSLYAWRQVPVSIAHTFTPDDIESYQVIIDHRQRVTHARMVGAYIEAEYSRDDLGSHRFREFKNPYLMSYLECYQEARLSIQRQEELFQTANFTGSYRPLLEPGDRVSVSGVDYIIDGYEVQPGTAQSVANFRLRKYVFGA